MIQTKSQKAYAKAYCDYTEFDYTHNANKYGLVTALPTHIDCLNKSCISGIGVNESETEVGSKEILDLFECTKPIYSQGVLMTDKGSAFESLAEKVGMIGINCSKHYAGNGDKASGGLGLFYDEFREGYNKIIYNDFDSDADLLKFIQELEIKCKHTQHKRSQTCLNGLKQDRFSVVHLHTK